MGYPSATRARSLEIALDPQRKAVIVEAALEAFEKYGTLADAAESVKIGRQALFGWINSNPEYRERYLEIDSAITDRIEKKAFELCDEKNPRMIEFMLERRHDRYKAKLEVTHKEALTLESVADRFRQAALANPTLIPTIKRALQMALDRLP